MKKAIFQKIKSDRGASIAVALILFLVCAAVGAVILTAATASAGRFSKLSEMDQRYYRVSSASELLANQLCGREVTIVRVKTVTTVTTLSFDGTTVTPVKVETTPDYKTKVGNVDDFKGDTSGLSFLSTRAVMLMYGSNLSQINTEDAMGYAFSNAENANTGVANNNKLSILHGESYDDLDINDITWTTKSDGTIEFTISSGENQNKYTIILTLVPEIEEKTTTVEDSPVTTTGTNGTGTRTEKTTITKTSTIKWKVGGIRKGVAST